jgi:transketolase
MRIAFIKALVALAIGPAGSAATADYNYEPFVESFPDRFINVGVAEQNMVGIATGLAEAGFVPFVYSIAPFAALRPFEFIRNGPVYHQLPVRIVGVGQGVDYGFNGHSHYGVDDVGVLRTQPGLTIIAPADDIQTKQAIEKTCDLTGPIYFRLGKDSFEIPSLSRRFELGQTQKIGDGVDVLLISSGAITREAVKAADLLREQGIRVTILVIASIAPAPVTDLVEALSSFEVVFTLESHYVTGGIGSLVAEIVAEHRLDTQVLRLGFDSVLNGFLGGAPFLHDRHGLSAEKLAAQVVSVMKKDV